MLSGSSSFTAGSRSDSPFYPTDALVVSSAHQLMRTISSSSLHEIPQAPSYPESSAKHHMQNSKITINYTPPEAPEGITARLLGCSATNIVAFARSNRIYFTNLHTNGHDDITPLYKLSDNRGHLRALEWGDKSHPDVLAVGTSKGFIQIWDVNTKKLTTTLPTTKDISALAWSGPVLTIGGVKGTIRHYDTRITPVEKMREQARKITRHQGQITCLTWNEDGKRLASGDDTGLVHCWESGQMVPLNVGGFVQRRKKIQHDSGISALNWSPWSSNLLATGDKKGFVQFWNINAENPQSNAATSNKLETRAVITGVHFSPQCKEILTTHGAQIVGPSDPYAPPKPVMENSLSVHSYSSLRHVVTQRVPADKPIAESILNAAGTKVIFSVPGEGKIHVCDVWTKRKEVKKQASFSSVTSLRIR
ncbi:hypothetical protein NLJ89_g1257 [Agrocybe chaxingu]|uniref:Anaphase-promoting complex subunit 4-like WD40 domain-containing protein n=1 Tax=Agrocybe chaxingu TaxID=84603 RepID=A0A9W8N0E3_9AGAR|nr:hypothetical protein NLJ89_g1257 [Agrocybe chaxingu]